MAQSPSHRFGQIIGETLERAIRPVLETVANELNFYLDGKGERHARGTRHKVAWTDGKGNAHDLDYVFEAGGSAETIGSPRAFIEIAWRRYTKHSRNKAQEIQGAIIPLAERYADCHPFLGVVLGGIFTEGSLSQLRSHGFTVLYFPYASIIDAFGAVQIDAAFDEGTPDSVLLRKVRQFEKLSAKQKSKIDSHLRSIHNAELKRFVSSLRVALKRQIEYVHVLALHGMPRTCVRITDAIAFIESFDESQPGIEFTRYEVCVRYSNADEVRGQFQDKAAAIAFLQRMQS